MNKPNIHLVMCTKSIFEHILENDESLAALLHIKVPENWSEFGNPIFEYGLSQVNNNPNSAKWWTYLPILIETNTLIGSCGFKGPPNKKGEVEIGYEVAIDFRNNGYATEITLLLIDIAFQNKNVYKILAHTLPEENASVRILKKCNFKFIKEIIDPEDGLIWQWSLNK